MGIISDSSGTYSSNPDGTRNYGVTTNIQMNGQTLYAFNPETGVLQASMSPSDLEVMLKDMGPIPEDGRTFVLDMPFMDGPAHFPGLRRIEPTPLAEGQRYLIRIIPVDAPVPAPKPKSLAERVFGYFRK